MKRIAICLLAVGVAACGGGEASKTDNANPTAVGATPAPVAGPAEGGSKNVPIDSSATAMPVVSMTWDGNEMLQVGYKGGAFASLEVFKRKGSTGQLADSAEIAAISPGGKLFFVRSRPPSVVDGKGTLLLRMSNVQSLESGAFSRDGSTVYAASSDGVIRFWGQAHSFVDGGGDEELQDYLNRQANDFRAQVNPIRGPVSVDHNGWLYFVSNEGVVSYYNPAKPSKSFRIMKVKGTPRSVDAADGYVYVTTETGQLKVGKLDPPSYLGWSREAKADYAAGAENYPGRFFSLHEGAVKGRDIETGDTLWEVELPQLKPCGLSVAPTGDTIAACVGGHIVVLSAKDGSVDSAFHYGSKLVWVDASNASISVP